MSTVGTTAAAGIVGLSVFSNYITAPTQIPGLQLWLDASSSNNFTLSNTSNVVQWNDKSSNGFHFQTVGGTPKYVGGTRGVFFISDSNDYMRSISPNITYTGGVTNVFVVGMFSNTNNSLMLVFGSNADNSLRYSRGSAPNANDIYYSTGQQIFNINGTSVPLMPQSSIFFYNIFSFVVGAQAFVSSPSYIQLSADRIIRGGSTLTGYINEVLIYSNALTANQRTQVEGYLAWKWGLNSNLPVSHFQLNSNVTGLPATVSTGNANTYNALFTNFITAPTQVAGLQLWLDASSSNNFTLSNTSNVVQWNDRSGNGRNFTTIVGSPRFTSPSQGVFFNGTTADCMQSVSNISYTNGVTSLFIVVKITAGGWGYIVTFGNSADYSLRYNGALGTDGNDAITSGNIWYLNGDTRSAGSPLPVSIFNATSLINGVVNRTDSTVIQLSLGPVTIGGHAGRYFTGFINEVLMYSNALTANQRTQVEGYLAWKWGINSNLPVAHYQQNSNVTGMPAPIPPSIVPKFTTSNFLPSTYSGLALWLDAADSATVLNPGTSNMVWVDKSGTSKNAIVSPSNASLNFFGTFPTYCNAGNIPASIQFNCNVMYSKSNINVAQNTFFIVLQNILPFTGSRVVFSIASSRQQPYNSVDAFEVAMNLFAGSSVTPSVAYGLTQGTYTPINFATQTVPSPSTNQYPFSMLSFTETNTATINTFTNGASAQSATNSGTRSNTGTGYAICGEWISGNNNVASTNMGTFNISEIILYSNVLTAQQQQNVEGYLSWKWGLTPSLPGTHQNAYIPP